MKYKNNFIIICESRTGSSMLTTSLQSHREICMHGEILQFRQFSHLFDAPADDILEFFGLDYDTPGSIIDLLRDELVNSPLNYVKKYGFHVGRFKKTGFKFKYEEMSHNLFTEVKDFMANQKEIKIIHLKRKNLWKRFKSSFIAQNITHEFNSTDSRIKVDTNRLFKIKIKEIKKSFDKSLKWQSEFDELFSEHQVLNITYEEILKNKQLSFDKVTDFLEIKNQTWQPWTKKIKNTNEDDLIKNIQDIRDYFENTHYEKYFND